MPQRAVIFPGQGVQSVGRGKDLYDAFAEAREIIDRADRLLDLDLKEILFEGPEERLRATENAQPAILTVNHVLFRLARARGFTFQGAAGHSLGEYNALVAVESMDFDDALRMVRERGRLMAEVGEKTRGTMAAVLFLDEQNLAEACRRAGEVGCVEIVNYNSPVQLVISGEEAAVRQACAYAKEAGARRAIPLKVSGAFHSSLLREASERLGPALQQVEIKPPRADFYPNVTGDRETDPQAIRRMLQEQVSSPVRWIATVQNLVAAGYGTFVEVGPGKVLSDLVAQIHKETERIHLNGPDALDVQEWFFQARR